MSALSPPLHLSKNHLFASESEIFIIFNQLNNYDDDDDDDDDVYFPVKQLDGGL